jgi:hypothetical protein
LLIASRASLLVIRLLYRILPLMFPLVVAFERRRIGDRVRRRGGG